MLVAACSGSPTTEPKVPHDPAKLTERICDVLNSYEVYAQNNSGRNPEVVMTQLHNHHSDFAELEPKIRRAVHEGFDPGRDCSKSAMEPAKRWAFPDYQNTLDGVTLSIALNGMTVDPLAALDLESEDDVIIDEPEEFAALRGMTLNNLRKAYGSLILSFPEYTQIKIITNAKDKALVEEFIVSLEKSEGVELQNRVMIAASASEKNVDAWMQDWGEWMHTPEGIKFVIPMSDTWRYQSDTRFKTRKETLEQLLLPENVVEAPFFFDGGNLSFDIDEDNNLHVFIGVADVEYTRATYEANEPKKERPYSRDEIVQIIQAWFGNDTEVHVVGIDAQPNPFFHHDQVFTLIRGGEAAFLNPSGFNVDATHHEEVGDLMGLWGYKMHTVNQTIAINEKREEHPPHAAYQTWHHASHAFHSQHGVLSTDNPVVVNSIPFVNRTDGEQHVLFPVDEYDLVVAAQGKLRPTRDDLKPNAQAHFDAYADMGLTPTPVVSWLSPYGGDIHCIMLPDHPSQSFRAAQRSELP